MKTELHIFIGLTALALLQTGTANPTKPLETICNQYCDGQSSNNAASPYQKATEEIFGRTIHIFISDFNNMAFGVIRNGDPGDEVWLDRSFDGGSTWSDNSKLGDVTIPEGARSVSTAMFNIDRSNIENRGIGALRVCGKAGNRDEIACTPWVRSRVLASDRAEAAAAAMMMQYTSGGLWATTGWWNAANCLTALIDYMSLSGDRRYLFAIDRTYELNRGDDFTNEYIDDTGWWGLAWVLAYDLTGDRKYLEMAEKDSDFMYATKDDHCGGGVWWTTKKDYKNAIPNELFIKLAAAIHNRIPGDTKYLRQAVEVWEWFEKSGMINSEWLVNDGLTDDCRNNNGETWTYNQGVIIGGLIELHKATGNRTYTQLARNIANAVIASSRLNPNYMLFEPCENGGGDCGGDGPSFKGVFMRNMREFNHYLIDRPYSSWLQYQSDINYNNNRNSLDQYGVHYAGPFVGTDAAAQHSAFEAIIAGTWPVPSV